MSDTEYVILRKTPDLAADTEEYTWEVYSVGVGSSGTRALRALEPSAGEYVAIPSRSWKPITVKTEQVTKVTIG